jgi:hypothetical protein
MWETWKAPSSEDLSNDTKLVYFVTGSGRYGYHKISLLLTNTSLFFTTDPKTGTGIVVQVVIVSS